MSDSRSIIVTGAASGIGLAVAQGLHRKGHCITLVDINENALDDAHRTLGEDERTLFVAGDASNEENAKHAADQTLARFGSLDVLFNNAGIGAGSLRDDAEVNRPSIEELTLDIYRRFFEVNVLAAVSMTRACIGPLKQAGWGRIINNTTSYLTMHRLQPYGATKSGLESISAVWAEELEGTGITVNVVVPGGPTDTPMVKEIGLSRQQMMRPNILVPPIEWLISREADGVSGRRFIAGRWDSTLTPAAAAAKCARSVGWPELTGDVVWQGK